ncbi:uncharacterized protein C8Q71DRAFT_49403 [Rhodofomes roseus]|uniref:HMG box domain-containing protein n=1 Tax=Rhodofomes roseus TaxID=34475 RepID=A0ABQ8KFN6_9APHY|nr:uncharacterized protein C8Q71DRAFT_49403 [Rhodofomes roseus]KAH9836592.1 hypothetical protein C8Q71DRAFT_49403 [Rhodofomes roseus]
MLFRSELWAKEKIKSSVERDHRMISRIAGKRWNELSESERTPFRLLAEAAKRQHAELYPDYKYSPVFKKEKLPRRKGAKGGDRDWARCNVVAGLLGDGYEGEELEKRMKSYDRKEMMYELASRRPRARAIQARKTRVVQREASPDTRSPSPAALPEDGLIKMEPSTPELSFSPEPVPQEPDVPEAVHPSYLLPPPPNINADEKKPFDRESSTGSSVGDEVGDEVASDRHWPDKSPAVLDLSVGANGQTYVQSPSQGLMIPVTLCAYPDDPFGEAVDDAFSISPMFNPDRSSALVGPKPSMLNIGSCSQADDVKAEDEFDFSEWLVSAH